MTARVAADAVRWTEIEIEAPATLRDRVLLDLVAPLLDDATAAGAAQAGLFLCDLRRHGDGRESTTVQLRETAAEAAPRALAALVAGAPRLADTVVMPPRPAERVPLAGSVMAGPALAPLGRTLLAEVTPLLLGLVRQSHGARLTAALDLRAAHLRALGPPAVPGAERAAARLRGAPLGFLSFHSHAEAFIASSRDSALTRRALDAQYGRIRSTAVGRISAILDDPTASKSAATWYAAVRSTRPAADEAFRTGSIRAEDDAHEVTELTGRQPGAFADSAFHTELAAAPGFLGILRTDPRFLGARLMTGLLYLSMAGIGITLAERYFLCHATSRACSEIFAADPVAVLAELARA